MSTGHKMPAVQVATKDKDAVEVSHFIKQRNRKLPSSGPDDSCCTYISLTSKETGQHTKKATQRVECKCQAALLCQQCMQVCQPGGSALLFGLLCSMRGQTTTGVESAMSRGGGQTTDTGDPASEQSHVSSGFPATNF